MKQLLFIAYNYPPDSSSGSNRTGALKKYLELYGWDVTVYTIPHPKRNQEESVIEIGDPGILNWIPRRRAHDFEVESFTSTVTFSNSNPQARTALRRIAYEIVYFPDPYRNWCKIVLEDIKVRGKSYDIVLTTSQPESAHILGRKIKLMGLARHWVADFRDLWTQNHFRSSKYSCVRNWLERNLEKRVIADADLLVTVSEPMMRKLREVHSQSKVITITNGFTPKLEEEKFEEKRNEFTILYSGQLYGGRRDPRLLFESLNELRAKGSSSIDRLRVQFYVGSDSHWLTPMVRDYGLESLVYIAEWIEKDRIIEEQQKATVLLLINWDHPEESGTYTGKVFEYLAAHRPILALGGPPGVLSELLKDTNSGYHLGCKSDVVALLEYWLEEYARTGFLDYQGDLTAIEKYSWPVIGEKYASALNGFGSRDESF